MGSTTLSISLLLVLVLNAQCRRDPAPSAEPPHGEQTSMAEQHANQHWDDYQQKVHHEESELGLAEIEVHQGNGQPRDSDTRVGFVGEHGQFRMYPPTGFNSSGWFYVQFAKIFEVDAGGNKVGGRQLQFAGKRLSAFTTGSTVYQGQNLTYVNMYLNLTDVASDPAFSAGCNVSISPDAFLTFRVYMGFTDNTTYYFGFTDDPDSVTVAPGAVKWTLLASKWPFCNSSNGLAFDFVFHSREQEMPAYASRGEFHPNSTNHPGRPFCNASSSAGNTSCAEHAPQFVSELKVEDGIKAVINMPLVAYDAESNATQRFNASADMIHDDVNVIARVVFPYFPTTLFYDPSSDFQAGAVTSVAGQDTFGGVNVLGASGSSGGLSANNKIVVGVVVGVGGFMLVVGAVVAVMVVRSRKANMALPK